MVRTPVTLRPIELSTPARYWAAFGAGSAFVVQICTGTPVAPAL
jgi:hypothetical protein